MAARPTNARIKNAKAVNSGPTLFARNAGLSAQERLLQELEGVIAKIAHYSRLQQDGDRPVPRASTTADLFGGDRSTPPQDVFTAAELATILAQLQRQRAAITARLEAAARPAPPPRQAPDLPPTPFPEPVHPPVSPKFLPSDPPPPADLAGYELPPGHVLLEADWAEVSFHTGYLSIRLAPHKWSNRFPIPNSRQSFGRLRSLYRFRGAPKLLLEMRNNEIRRILNKEVLEYYLQFLDLADEIYTRYKTAAPGAGPAVARPGHPQRYLHRHLPQIFRTDCFELLCRKAADDLPVIPMPELVISSDGAEQIHDSFLFPVRWNQWVFVVWESTETAKATYCFQFAGDRYEDCTQRLFDYLAGPGINKRNALAGDRQLWKDLGATSRIFHKSFAQWRSQLPFPN